MKSTILDQKYGFVLEFCSILSPNSIEKQDKLDVVNKFERTIIVNINKNITLIIGLDEFNNNSTIISNHEISFSVENSNLYSLLNETMTHLKSNNLIG